MKKTGIKLLLMVLMAFHSYSQNYTFNFQTSGRRVCLVSSEVDWNLGRVKIIFHDSIANSNEPLSVKRRLYGTHDWSLVASNLSAGTGHWTDTNVALGEVWEYQVKRENTWSFGGNNYSATGYTMGVLLKDNTQYKGQMILLVANDVSSNLSAKYARLKKELTSEGWFVNELVVQRATNWDSGSAVVGIKNQLTNIYNNAPINDKPKSLFILGHVPMPRCGATNVVAPDDHSQNTGARGCDGYYADIDGNYTDVATYNPVGLTSTLAINMPNDYKWDQDFFPSTVEMAFGRIDFADLTEISTPEMTLLENYLDRLSNYKNVSNGYYMGENAAYNLGYNNSNDGSYRSLVNISKPQNVYEKTDNSNHNQWVQNHGPFKIYMQNVSVPSLSDWQTYGMQATVYSSDQSYWGFGDVPQPNGVFSRIRSLLGVSSKCLITMWTTTGLNIFHQACNGQSIGTSMLDIINHNATNQHLEKPPQQYDTQDWWNRTHFEIWGDPTISLYQVKPISNLSITNNNGTAILQWNASIDNAIFGYHIYQSTNQNGVFERITNEPITTTSFQIPNYTNGNWYMVKATKIITSGCGSFLQPSIGVSIQANIDLSTSSFLQDNLSIFPNPAVETITIASKKNISQITIYNSLGQIVWEKRLPTNTTLIDLKSWKNGIYFIEIYPTDGMQMIEKIVKKDL